MDGLVKGPAGHRPGVQGVRGQKCHYKRHKMTTKTRLQLDAKRPHRDTKWLHNFQFGPFLYVGLLWTFDISVLTVQEPIVSS